MLFTRLLIPAIAALVGYNLGKAKGETSRRLALPPAPPEPIMMLGPNCSSWEILDQPRFELTFKFVYVRERLRGITDPLAIANAISREIVPMCRRYGEAPPRNRGELDLYKAIAEEVVSEMVEDQTLTPESIAIAQQQVAEWEASLG